MNKSNTFKCPRCEFYHETHNNIVWVFELNRNGLNRFRMHFKSMHPKCNYEKAIKKIKGK